MSDKCYVFFDGNVRNGMDRRKQWRYVVGIGYEVVLNWVEDDMVYVGVGGVFMLEW